MTVKQADATRPDGSELSAELGPALEKAASECLAALAGVDTYDVNLRDHGDSWAAIEAFAAKVRAADPEPKQWSSRGLLDIAAERRRQIDAEGWTPAHDDKHENGEMSAAAACYALGKDQIGAYILWPWSSRWWKPRDLRSNYVRAAALLLAEIERLDRSVDPEPHDDPQAIFGDPRA